MKIIQSILAMTILLIAVGCGSSFENPVERIKHQLKDVPTFSIILEDMKQDGNVFTHYFHKYKVVQLDKSWVTDWEEVSDSFYRQNANFLGMTLAARKEGQYSDHVAPPGYAYVGDPKYGQWKQDASGGSFWEFYGKYRMFTDVLGFLPGQFTIATMMIIIDIAKDDNPSLAEIISMEQKGHTPKITTRHFLNVGRVVNKRKVLPFLIESPNDSVKVKLEEHEVAIVPEVWGMVNNYFQRRICP
ncbi:MAG: hypothetical protein OMM_01311 [Candidatus Magnetoglobus multicellularis str. Araruama]|uniref:Lipoprotein n=1 Tax=Candidatus Magnetoglobus multicellularis str. Araruama TaxID=890399 RepID=A0A1V1PDU7_9BACT|nr:MAG: hypothetical protein OMM_01311 [Candidatus Magnetoglobus multicellularis str. Araruama]